MRFEEAYEGWTERHLSQEEAASLLVFCYPHSTMKRNTDQLA